MSNKLENLLIIDAFKTLEISPWKIRKVFLKELRTNKKVIINGFAFIEDTYDKPYQMDELKRKLHDAHVLIESAYSLVNNLSIIDQMVNKREEMREV